MQFPVPYGESLKLKKPSRSNFGDEKDIYTDLTVVPLQFPSSSSFGIGFTKPLCNKKEHSLGCNNGHHTG